MSDSKETGSSGSSTDEYKNYWTRKAHSKPASVQQDKSPAWRKGVDTGLRGHTPPQELTLTFSAISNGYQVGQGKSGFSNPVPLATSQGRPVPRRSWPI